MMTELIIDKQTINDDLIRGIALQIDYTSYYTQLIENKCIPEGTTYNKLSMWKYYKTHPNKFPIKLSKPTDHLRQYQNELKNIPNNGVNFNSFDVEYYLSMYDDVALACKDSLYEAYKHWVGFGVFEMRKFRILETPKNRQINFTEVDLSLNLLTIIDSNKPMCFDCNFDHFTFIIDACIDKYTFNKRFKYLLSTLLKDTIKQLSAEIGENLSLVSSINNLTAFIKDIVKIINVKGYTNHLSHGTEGESVIDLIKDKLNLYHGKILLVLKKTNFLKKCAQCNPDSSKILDEKPVYKKPKISKISKIHTSDLYLPPIVKSDLPLIVKNDLPLIVKNDLPIIVKNDLPIIVKNDLPPIVKNNSIIIRKINSPKVAKNYCPIIESNSDNMYDNLPKIPDNLPKIPENCPIVDSLSNELEKLNNLSLDKLSNLIKNINSTTVDKLIRSLDICEPVNNLHLLIRLFDLPKNSNQSEILDALLYPFNAKFTSHSFNDRDHRKSIDLLSKLLKLFNDSLKLFSKSQCNQLSIDQLNQLDLLGLLKKNQRMLNYLRLILSSTIHSLTNLVSSLSSSNDSHIIETLISLKNEIINLNKQLNVIFSYIKQLDYLKSSSDLINTMIYSLNDILNNIQKGKKILSNMKLKSICSKINENSGDCQLFTNKFVNLLDSGLAKDTCDNLKHIEMKSLFHNLITK